MADETKNDTMSAILSEMEGFKCRNLETGELEKCHPISGYLHDRIKAVYERDTKELVDSLRETTQCMCAHCQFKPCEENERDENGFHLPCRVVYDAQRLIAKYESFGKKDGKTNDDDDYPF